MDLQSIKVIWTRSLSGDDWYMWEGGQTIFASPTMTAKMMHPNKPHDQIDELNRIQRTQIDRRFQTLENQISNNRI